MSDVVVHDQARIRTIAIDRPASRNGLTTETCAALIAALADAPAAGARAVILTGAGGHFCSGLDLKDAMRRGVGEPAQVDRDLRERFHGVIRAIRACPSAVIAAIDGAAVGFGCDLALACDLRVASDRGHRAQMGTG